MKPPCTRATHARRNRPFRSKADAMGRARSSWLCTACRRIISEKPKGKCDCGGAYTYFPSRIELERASQLLILQDNSVIRALKFHPRFDLKVNGEVIGRYVADSRYEQIDRSEPTRPGWRLTVEDVKPKRFMTDLAKWKIKHFNAQYPGVVVSFIR